MESVRLDAVSSSATSLSLLDPHFESGPVAHSEAYWMKCRARLDTDRESSEAVLTVIQPYREDTIDFFDKLASMPDDWLGGASWYSEGGELSLDVQGQPRGVMAVRVELREMAHLEPAVGEFLVTAHELRRFASSLHAFMRVPSAETDWKGPEASPLGRWSFTKPPSTGSP